MDALYEHMSAFYRESDYKWVVLFPEGGLANPRALAKAQEYARQRDLPVYDHLLQPRHGAAWQILKAFQDARSKDFTLSSIVDLTIIYGKYEKPTWAEVILGRAKAMDVHVHIKVRPVPDIIDDDQEALGIWLRQVWSEKDALINAFLEDAENVVGHSPKPLCTGGVFRMILVELFFIIVGYLSFTLNFYFYTTLTLFYVVIAISTATVLFIHKNFT